MEAPSQLSIHPKAWGHNTPVKSCESFEVHYASIESHGFSSAHCHMHKYNQFFVLYGTLIVQMYGSEADAAEHKVAEEVILTPGSSFTVPPRVWHRFQAGDFDVDLIEVYWPQTICASDIKRVDVGGKGEPDVTSF